MKKAIYWTIGIILYFSTLAFLYHVLGVDVVDLGIWGGFFGLMFYLWLKDKEPPKKAKKFPPPPKWTPEDAVNLYRYMRESTALKLAPGEEPMTDEEALDYFTRNYKPTK